MIARILGVLPDALRLDGVGTDSTGGSNPPPAITREEQVIRSLSSSGGYRWQGEIVDELDFSAATTSRTLGEMEEDGRITRYQIGRRKVVCLPEQEPKSLRQPATPAETLSDSHAEDPPMAAN